MFCRVDRGTVVRKKAKQVLKLLTEDAYLKDERDKAKKLTKTILGQGSSQSSSGQTSSSRYGGFGNTDMLSSGRKGHEFDTESEEFHIDKKFTAFEERILSEKRGNRPEKKMNAHADSTNSDGWKAFEDDATPVPSTANVDETSWANFSVRLLDLVLAGRGGTLRILVWDLFTHISSSPPQCNSVFFFCMIS